MKIILLRDLKSIGKKDDIKEVKDGYAKFLIAKKDAVAFTNKSHEILNTQLKEKESEEKLLIQENEEIKKKIEKLELLFKVKVGKDNKVFGVITPKMISEELKKNSIEINKKKIEINGQLNVLGSSSVKINLYKNIKANLKIIIKS